MLLLNSEEFLQKKKINSLICFYKMQTRLYPPHITLAGSHFRSNTHKADLITHCIECFFPYRWNVYFWKSFFELALKVNKPNEVEFSFSAVTSFTSIYLIAFDRQDRIDIELDSTLQFMHCFGVFHLICQIKNDYVQIELYRNRPRIQQERDTS